MNVSRGSHPTPSRPPSCEPRPLPLRPPPSPGSQTPSEPPLCRRRPLTPNPRSLPAGGDDETRGGESERREETEESRRRGVCVCVCVYLGLVFLGSMVFVGADVIHQVSLLVLLFIAVLCVLQEVERLQNVTWTPDTPTHRCNQRAT